MVAKCGHCGNVGTRLEEISPAQSQYKMMAVCCGSCSAILGVTDYFNTGTLLKNAEKERGKVETKIDQITHTVRQIADAVRRR